MAEPPPPPVITITDPHHAAPLSDVIGEEPARPPRRLTPAQKRLAWLCAAIVATVYGGIWGVTRIRTAQRLDRQALAEVSVVLSGGDSPTVGTDSIELVVLSTGPHPLTVLSARVAAPGFPLLEADDNRLRPREPAIVTFSTVSDCPRSVSLALDASLVLRVRTYRGDEKTLELPPEEAGGSGLLFQLMEHCGLFSPGNSLQVDAPGGFPIGDDLTVTLPLHNRASSARTITRVTVNGGLRVVSVDTPVQLEGRGQASLAVRLHVTDCPAALGTWALEPQDQGFTPTFRGVGGGSLDTTVAGDGVEEEALGLLSAGDPMLTDWIQRTCG
jgi:hypothetical protein